jgi:Fe-S cluster assembly iron-binding protein IscA
VAAVSADEEKSQAEALVANQSGHGHLRGGQTMIVVTEAAREQLAARARERGIDRPLRVRLQFAGCCDPTLGLGLDQAREDDHVLNVGALTLVMDPKTAETAGEVTVDWVDRGWERGFVLTSQKPLSEWEGLTLCAVEGL